MSIERCEDADDDWAVFEYGELGVAASDYKLPPAVDVGDEPWGRIRVSARSLVRLLSGEITQEQFLAGSPADHLRTMANEGRLLTSVSIERDANDDWMVLEYGEPDAAVSEFRLPHGVDTGD